MRGRLLKRFIPTRSGGDISDDGCGAAWDGSSRLRLVPPEKAYCILRNKVGARAAMTTIVGASNTTFACLAAPRRARGMGLKTDDISPPTNARPDEFSCGQGYLLASRGRRAPLTGPHPRPRLRPAHGRFCPRACTRAAGRGGGSRAKRGHSRSKMGNETPKQKGSCGVLAKLFISLFYPPPPLPYCTRLASSWVPTLRRVTMLLGGPRLKCMEPRTQEGAQHRAGQHGPVLHAQHLQR